ncbi:hypothetical protein ACFLYN_05295 [Chloroflexota bacterium]
MSRKFRYLGIVVMLTALASIVLGGVFLQQGFSKEAFLVGAMEQEKITASGVEGIVDSASKAQAAGDVVREHRHGISPTYGDLLAGGRFDPTNPTQLSYAQALNLENYLYLAVASFGVFTVVKAIGAFMLVTGLGLGVTGYGLFSRT